MKTLFTSPLKKFKNRLTLMMTISLLIIVSCKKEQIDSRDASPINWARDYYNSSLNAIKPNSISINPSQQIGSSKASIQESTPTPLWQLATSGNNNGFSFVEVPLDYTQKAASIIITPGQNLTDAEKKEMANASFDILLIYKNNNGAMNEQVVSLIPDLSYLKKHGDLKRNKLAKLDTAFSGYLAYNSWKGQKMFLERIENGLLVRTNGIGQRILTRVAKPTKSSKAAIMRATMGGDENCVTIEYNTYWIECWQIFSETSCSATWIGEGSNTYCSSGGGNIEETFVINAEDPGEAYELLVVADSIKLVNRFNCFNSVPTNNNTKYSIKICADIPVNSNSKVLLDGNRAPGHTFIELTKTNGTNSVTETIGFYPESATKAAFQLDVNSMMVDNRLHPYDASLFMTVDESQFEKALITAKNKSANDYNMIHYNCTTFALDVFNSARESNNQLIVPNTVPQNTMFSTYGKTPNGLYNKIKGMVTNGVGGASGTAGTGSQSTNCN